MENWEYEVKCRRCGKIVTMSLGSRTGVDKSTFRTFISEHFTVPIEKQCGCNNGMMMLHDIVSYGPILAL